MTKDQEQRLSNCSHMFIGHSGSNSSTVPEYCVNSRCSVTKFPISQVEILSVTLKLKKISIFTHIMLED